MKKTPGDITLHISSKNHDHMMHGSWDMVHDRQTNGWTEGLMDGLMDRQKEKVTLQAAALTNQ